MATPTKWGDEFLVNSTTNSDQFGPAITGLSNGRFLVTWTDNSAGPPDFTINVRAQIFNANGTAFRGEFLVNTTTTDTQNAPQVTALSGGRFAVAFQDLSQLQGTNSADVRVQVFNANGTKSGLEFIAPTTVAGVQAEPAIAALIKGRYVVVWTDSSGTSGDTSDAIVSQVFRADGTKLGAEHLVNTLTVGQQHGATVTALAGGDYVVAWTSNSVDSNGSLLLSVNAQRFHASGAAVGGEYQGLTVGGFNIGQSDPTITGLSGGRYVLAWRDVMGFDSNINAQMFNGHGALIGGNFTVNTTSANDQGEPSIAPLKDGGYVVVWTDNGPFTGTGFNPEIRAQAFHANGSLNGAEFVVNTYTTNLQRAPSVATLADGRFVVTWEDLSGTLGDTTFAVHAQIFDPRSAAVTLVGTGMADDLIGTRYGDTLQGNGGNDTLTGGRGADVFIFAPGEAHDRITDFGTGADQIDLTAFGFASVAQARSHFANVGADCVFSLGSDDLTVIHFATAQIDGSNLIL
ncbi:MAG: hypothetical protein ABI832_05810 [bacterium]